MTREMIDKVKEMVKDTRCLDKLYDAISCTIANHADYYADEFDTDTDTMATALEEIVYKMTYSDEELEEMQPDEE